MTDPIHPGFSEPDLIGGGPGHYTDARRSAVQGQRNRYVIIRRWIELV